MMKRLILVLAILSLIALLLSFFVQPLILYFTRQALGKVFVKSSVSIGGCILKPTHNLRLSDIEIKRGNTYDFKIKEVELSYNLSALGKMTIPKIKVSGLEANLDLERKALPELNRYLNLKSKALFSVGAVELSAPHLDIKSANLNLKANIRLEWSLTQQSFNYINLGVDNLDAGGLHLERLNLNSAQGEPGGQLFIQRLQFDKLKIDNIKSRAVLEGKILSLGALSADVFSGKIQGDSTVFLGGGAYTFDLKAFDLSLEALVNELNLGEKVQLTGNLQGKVNLRGEGAKMLNLSGNFLAVDPGGTLVIKDDKVLQGMAKNTGQSLDMLVESFKDYRYNKGEVKVSLEGKDLVLEVKLDGAEGRRNLIITMHDFQLWRWE